jgi:hypothetical protein
MADIKIVDASGKEVNTASKIDTETPQQISGPALPRLLEDSVAELMGIEDSAEKNRSIDKINTLIDYAKSQTKDHSPENIKWIIRSLELKLGTPPLAEKRINYVARYAYLMSEKSKLDKELMSFQPI